MQVFPEKLITRTRIELLTAFLAVILLSTKGYASYEEYLYTAQIDSEQPSSHHVVISELDNATSSIGTTTAIIEATTTSNKNSPTTSTTTEPVIVLTETPSSTTETSSNQEFAQFPFQQYQYTGTTTIPILLYHKIDHRNLLLLNENKQMLKFSVQADVFDAQMKYIVDQNYTVLTLEQLIKAKNNNTMPEKPLVITLDDGWRSQYADALPILLKYNLPATFYIYTEVIDAPLYMTWGNLQSLVEKHMEIADHTMRHPRLTKVAANTLYEELVQSRYSLEKTLHITVSDFAYPYGDYNARILQAVKDAGYTSARTTHQSKHNDFKNMYQLNTINVENDIESFKRMLR